MSLDKAKKRKGFNRSTVDAVEGVIGKVIDPVLPEKQKDAIEPGSEGGLRRGKVRAKKLPAKKPKRAPFYSQLQVSPIPAPGSFRVCNRPVTDRNCPVRPVARRAECDPQAALRRLVSGMPQSTPCAALRSGHPITPREYPTLR